MSQINNYTEFPEFVPVYEELAQMATYWLSEITSLEWYMLLGHSGRDRKRRDYAHGRIHELALLLGAAQVERLGVEAAIEFCAEWSPEERQVFMTGSPEERTRLADMIYDLDCAGQ